MNAADPFGLQQKHRHEVETAALEGNENLAERGAAKAELLRRDHIYDQENELWKLLTEATTRDAQGAIRIILAVNGGVAAGVLACWRLPPHWCLAYRRS